MSIHNELQFSIDPEVEALGIRGAFLVMSGITNTTSNPEFDKYREDICDKLRHEYTKDFIKTDPVIRGFRDLHTKVGRSNRKYPSAPETLLSLLSRTGKFPAINLAVDIYNLVSIESRLALGAHDISSVHGNIQLKITDGTEGFTPLGSSEPESVGTGEYSYVDDANDVLCRLEYKQVEKTKVTIDTRDCFYIIQGNETTSAEQIQSAKKRLVELTKEYCGGSERVLFET